MTFWITFAIFTMCMVGIWAVFIVARIHLLKFKGYSHHIAPVTKGVAIALLVLSIIGYYFVLNISKTPPSRVPLEKRDIQEIY